MERTHSQKVEVDLCLPHVSCARTHMHIQRFKQHSCRVSVIAQKVMVPATRPDDLSLVLNPHGRRRETASVRYPLAPCVSMPGVRRETLCQKTTRE